MSIYSVVAVMCREAYEYDCLEIGGGTQATFGSIDNKKIVAFRGTEFQFDDILRDIRGVPWWSEELQAFCHSGFLKAARAAREEVEDFARGEPLILAGHSLGGAIARILAGFLQAQDVGVITFGEPRSIIWQQDHLLNPVSRRFVNGKDIVPSHPWPIFGYRHQVRKTPIGKKEGIFEDHQIQNYINSIGRRSFL